MKIDPLRILKNPDSRGYFFAIYTTPRAFVPLSSVKPREGSKYEKNAPSLGKTGMRKVYIAKSSLCLHGTLKYP